MPPALAIGVLLALLQAAWGFAFSHSLLEVDLGDEGIVLVGGERVLHGQVPYRDFFALTGPAIFYLTAAGFKVFGTNILAARWLAMSIATLTIVLLYCLCRPLLTPGAAGGAAGLFIVAGLPSWPMLSHHWLATLTSLCAVASLALWLRGRTAAWAALAGGWCALTVLTVQTAGALLIPALLACCWLSYASRQRRAAAIAALLLGGALVATPVLASLALAGGLPQLIYDTVIWPLIQYGPAETKLTLLPSGPLDARRALAQASTATLLMVGVLVVGAALWSAWRRRSYRRNQLLLLGLGALGMVAGMLYHPDRFHFVYALPLPLGLLSYWLVRAPSLVPARYRTLVITLEALGVVAFALPLSHPYTNLAVFTHAWQPAQYAVITPRGALYTETAAEAATVRVVVRFMRDHVGPGETAWIGPHLSLLYFLSDTMNPTDFEFLNPEEHSREQIAAAAASLIRARPRAAVWSPLSADTDMDPRAFWERLEPLELVLARCYAATAVYRRAGGRLVEVGSWSQEAPAGERALGEVGAFALLVYDPLRCD